MAKRRIRLPRINMIVGKKQIIVAGLTLLLGAAIYVNYIYTSSGRASADNLALPYESAQSDLLEEAGGSYYGDAAFVSGGSEVGMTEEIRAYFAQARMDLQESRDEAKEFLQAMYHGGDARSDELEVLARNAERLKSYIEVETKVENLLKAQGFADALCYISDRGANIIVKTPGLDAAGAAIIKNALLSEISVPAENITIVEIN
ncbi:MAG: SpoIIIAH-like family protein [Oscillospiraceae bacterium]|nr:SpoIIIAH-like family protein [Oscillospiraceae bacterium]